MGVVNSFDDAVEMLLVYMDRPYAQNQKMKHDRMVPLREFGPAFVVMSGDREVDHRLEENRPDDWFFDASEVTQPDITPNLNQVTLVGGSDPEVTAQLTRVRAVNMKQVRGRVERPMPHMVEVVVSHLYENDTMSSAKMFAGWRAGQWAHLQRTDTNGHRYGVPAEKLDTIIKMAQSVALTRRYTWEVTFRWEDGPGVVLSTDPVGVGEVFALRDIPEGRTRRSALRHWVREHWRRQGRSAPEVETKVRAHLRGATEFTWGSLRCVLRPSLADLERAQALRASVKS